MDAEQLWQLAARHAVFVTTAIHTPHPGDDFERWRRGWAEINRLVDEINDTWPIYNRVRGDEIRYPTRSRMASRATVRATARMTGT